ncbi:alpha-2-macroglobulin family protein [Piscinibacter sp.]|uniref:alpha-2-macroglobulin family protein n=1 Tax=Piscinibacter sp. TaxID=1903157 RepID=UPI0039E31756
MRAGMGKAAAAWLAALACTAAQAVSVATMTPRGEVAQVRQVTLRFSEAVVPFGDLRLPDPARVRCEGTSISGRGRWADERTWLYDFSAALPPGSRCTLQIDAGWKPLNGSVSGAREFGFGTGGPAVVSTQPWSGATIEEDQHFLLRLSGAAAPASVAANAWCEVEGIGERLPLKIVEGAAREAVLKARRLSPRAGADALLAACQRPLPPDARVRLVWGRGIAAQANPKVLTSVEQRFEFRVRAPFQAEFSCERERAGAPCLPIRPLSVGFSSAVPRALAAQLRLQPEGGGQGIAPAFDKDDKSEDVQHVAFPTPLAANARFRVVLPAGLKDSSGRALTNASSFPLAVATGDAPPIAKFAAAPFGIVEREAGGAVLPVTLRHVQGELRPAGGGGAVRIKRLDGDAEVLAWYAKVLKYHEARLSAKELGLPSREWTETVRETDARGRVVERRVERYVGTREVSLLASDAQAQRLELPALAGGDPRPFEVVGIPLAQPGFHVVEIESRRLGQALLDRDAPVFVRSAVLATNLGVHVKIGRENALVWVTSLDRGKPVADAEVAVNDCRGARLWAGRSDASGIARVERALAEQGDCPADGGFFVTARSGADMAFVFSSWQKGIEPWRFAHPTASGPQAETVAHTVFDRTLLRAGETVAMKHFVRGEAASGLVNLDAKALPDRAVLVHEGSGEEVVLPLAWSGTRSATSSWHIPAAAKLGSYRVLLQRSNADERLQQRWDSGDFRVEEFRVPMVDARVSGPRELPIAPAALDLAVQLNFLSGGAMGNAPIKASALLRPRGVSLPGYEDYSFQPPRGAEAAADETGDEDSPHGDGVLVADKLALATDKAGAATVALKNLPKIERPSELLAEVSYTDPNGEAQTVATTLKLWPAAVLPGIRAGSWASVRGKVNFTALALDTAGKPLKGQALEVRARLSQVISTRKRIVGGFYAYDNRTEVKELGTLCTGSSDERGQLACEAKLDSAGQVELVVAAKDGAGRVAEAATDVWVTRHGELWFAQDNDDRVDLLPEKKRYEPGETATLQLRMPFRAATALVAIEREGVMDTRVVALRGDDPNIALKIEKGWAPNVYVSVLALRGRVREVPWYSLFQWGWKQPLAWWRAYRDEGPDYAPPTAMVDLAKPAFKLGVAALQVGLAEHELQVKVAADQPQYAVRQTAKARIQVLHAGQPLANAEVAFAAVDEGLLALRGNASWDLLHAMLRQRAWGVATATGQSEIVGRRHYGRKAVAAGGGGGRGGTRELFDTLLLWKDRITLDAKGEALVEVPLNDSLTSFRLVAIADDGAQRFGSGATSIRVTQDLQMLSGLPPLVREGDRFAALLTLRNTTARAMTLRATLAGTANGNGAGGEIVRTPLNLPPQALTLAAGAAQEVSWPIDVPADAFSITWQASVQEQGGAGAKDALKVTQQVSAAVPVRVLQATLAQLDGGFSLPVAAPADALPASGAKRGGLSVGLQPRLTGALPGLRRFFESYPFVCLEQKVSKAVGLRDAALWATVSGELPGYLDGDGLANYFPPRAEDGARGSDRLTAYLIAATHEAGFALPEAARKAMLDGLAAFVEGRIERRFWSPRADLDVRKLAALEALSRHGRAQPRMLGAIKLTPNLWPTAAVIDWLSILRRVEGIPERAGRIEEAQQILRARLTFSGSTLRFSTEDEDFWWWLMDSADANAARLILATLDEPGWKDDLPRLVVGSLARQKRGAWLTTTANLWGSLALDKFSARFEAEKVAGRSSASSGAASRTLDWAAKPEGDRFTLPWPAAPGTLAVNHQGAGKPWLTVQSLAAIPLEAPLRAGYAITRSVGAVERKDGGRWSRGDVMRVRLEIDAQSDMSWVVVSDPVPAGATLLGSGLGRDSALATRGEKREGGAWLAYEERSFEAWRGYYEFLPRGRHVVEYSVRLNNPGRFALPPTRVEAMYAPEAFGELPNAALEVAP